MALTYGAIGTTGATTGTTSVTASYPASISAATSKLYLIVTGRSNTALTASTITGGGWTMIGAIEGGTGTWATDAGTRRVEIWRKDTVTGAETGSITINLAGTAANTLYARIVRVEVGSGNGISEQFVSGDDQTAGTGVSITATATALFTAGDLVLVGHAGPVDTATLSAQALVASGVTFGTFTNRSTIAVTGGNDHRHAIQSASVTTGSGTPAAPTFSYTASAATSGAGAFLVLTEVIPPSVTTQPKNAFVIDGSNASFSLTASNYTGLQWQELISSGGGGTVTLGATITAVNTSATVTSFATAAYNQAAGDAIAVRVKWEGTATPPTSVTDTAGNTYVARTARLNGTAGVQIFDCMSTLAHASNIITVTWPGNIASYISLAPIRFTITGTASFVAEAGSPNTGTGTAVATGAFNAGDFAVAEVGTAGTGASGTAGTGWTEDVEHGAAVGAQSMYRVDTPGGTIQAQSTLSVSSPWFAAATSYTVGAGATWTDISGETSTSLSLPGVTTTDEGRQFRAKLTNAAGETITNIVSLHVSPDGLIEYRTETTGGVESATTSVNVPAISVIEGELDLLIIGAGVIGGAAPTMVTPAGYTKAGQATDLPLAGVVNTTLCLFWRNATAPGAVVSVTAGASSLWGWTRIAYRFQDPDDPIEAFDLGWLAASTAHVLPGYTASKADHLYIGWVSQAIAQGGTVPPPMIRRVNDEGGGIVLGDEQISATGATGTRTITVASSADTTYAVVGVNSLASTAGGGTETDLTLADLLHAHALDAVTLTTLQPLALADLAHAHSLDAVVLSTGTSLVPADLAHSQALDAVALTLDTSLAPADMLHAHALDAVTLSTQQLLAVANLLHAHSLESVTLNTSSTVTLALADMLHGHTLDAVTLSALESLTVADLTQGHTLDTVALSTLTGLTVADLTHAHSLEPPAVNTALSLALADLLHAHGLEAVTLSSETALAPADLTQGHALEPTVLTSLVMLEMADLLHAHMLAAVTLSTDDSMTLNVAEMSQAHLLESPTLSAEVGLIVARLVHSQILDGVTLGALTTLVVADMLQGHALDAVTLASVPALQVARLTQAHALDSVSLSALATLVVSDMLHAHRLDGVTLSGDDVETEKALIVRGRPRFWYVTASRREWRVQ